MNDFLDMMNDGFAQMQDIFGVTITANGVTKSCVPTGIEKRFKNSQYSLATEIGPRAEMLRTDYAQLGLEKEGTVTIKGIEFVFMGIGEEEEDAADPCVNLILEFKP